MKKILKGLLIIIFILLVAVAAVAFFTYCLVNNAEKYNDIFTDYETELKEYADSRFEDFIFYDRDENQYRYTVPFVLLYDTVNIQSMSEYLSLPEELQIRRMGMVPDLENRKIDIYLDINVRDLFDTCLIIRTVYDVSEDGKRLEMRFDDFYLISNRITEEIKKRIDLNRDDLMFTQKFPVFVPYYQMPDFKSEYVSDVRYEDGMVKATYDIRAALEKYLSENRDNPLEMKLEAIDLEMRKAGIAH